VTILAWTVLASLLLGLRFSPNWVQFLAAAREAEAAASYPAQKRAIDRAMISGASERGALVTDQKSDWGVSIDDPNHKALRWRLLPAVIGRVLQLSDWATLGLAHLGCLALVLCLVGLGMTGGQKAGLDGLWLALTAGASAPLITSLGWLGYYDSLLALGLLAVAFMSHRGGVAAACLLTPWVDERFVIAVPLALLVRWYGQKEGDLKTWIRREALAPIFLTLCFAGIRLRLGGSGGSQTVEDYVRTFVFGQEITAADRAFGAWSGLRISWLVIFAGLLATWLSAHRDKNGRAPAAALALGLMAVVTGLVGAISAQDTARSMVLLFPLVPWAWKTAAEYWPRAWAWSGPTLALIALAAPAHQVFGKSRIPVPPDPSQPADHPLARAENNLGYLHDHGHDGVRNPSEAAKWYRRAAEAGLAEAQFNLAVLLVLDPAAKADRAEIERWLVAAAQQGLLPARRSLAFLYYGNKGFTKDLPRAWAWLSIAGEQVERAKELFGELTPEEQAEAIRIKSSLLTTRP
jgi:hypothetical protein